MDEHMLLDGVLRGVLGGRRKRSRKALRYLTGRRGGFGSLVNANTLLTAAGVAWGIFETMQNQQGMSGSPVAAAPTGGAGASPSPAVPPPPLPDIGGAATVPPDTLRMIRLAISAGSADGTLGEKEREVVLEQARAAGAEHVVEQELRQRRPLAEIVAGVSSPADRATLYVLAFGIIRADEAVSGAERIYLAQLAHLLGLDPETVTRLETEASTRIDSEKD
jgi:uncharacterized membrane protein YebE (DUF533 family)